MSSKPCKDSLSKKIIFVLALNLVLCYSNIAQVSITSSNLPIIIINTNGKAILDEPKIIASMGVIDNGEGKRNNITDSYNGYNGKIGIEIRGHSSQMFPKKQYSVELRDDLGNDATASLLGMPEESDWVFNASYADKTLLRNVLAYKIGNDLCRYATRTKFFELVINNQYMGIYILQEKIKRDKNRVNISKMETTDLSGDALTGGYIIHIDRIDAGDKYFVSDFPSVYPLQPRQPSPINYIIGTPTENTLQPAQLNYIQNYIRQFETSLSKTTYLDPLDGYNSFIDADAWADYFLASEFTKATDAYRLSAYLYKDRDSKSGKLIFGPMWDYDLAFGLADYNQGWLSTGWVAQQIPWEGNISPPFWIKKIFDDPVMNNKIAKRWHMLKGTIFNSIALMKFLDDYAVYLAEARNRNFAKWPELFNTSVYVWPNRNRSSNYADELAYLKAWIAQRISWMDANLPADYSDIEWKQPGKRWLLYQTGKTLKLPLNIFFGNYRNVSTLKFYCKDQSVAFSFTSDSLQITTNKLGEFTFKMAALKGANIVSISPEYKINLATSVEEEKEIPINFSLEQNYPNPFNPCTAIRFKVQAASYVTLKVYDVLGNEVATLVNEIKQPGSYNYKLSIINYKLFSGVYFYRLTASNSSAGSVQYFSETKKMVLLK